MDADSPEFLRTMAAGMQSAGLEDRALALYREAVERDPQYLPAWAELVRCPGFVPDDDVIAHLRDIAGQDGLDDEDMAYVGFALGRALDHRGRFDEAWPVYRWANRAAARIREYHRTMDLDHLRAVQALMDDEFFAARATVARPDTGRRLIFVFGLPRSGTTLVEQILCSHPDVRGGGELEITLQTAVDIYKLRRGRPYVETLASLDVDQLDDHVATAAAAYGRAAGTSPRLTDKLPANYRHVGLLALMFPNASFVHVERDPMDALVSMYTLHFGPGHPYTTSLSALVAVWSDHSQLMAHWSHHAPVEIHRVQYEDLVHDQEGETRAMVEHCGLTWDDRCLAFDKNPRHVLTGSHFQVRRPIYTSSIGSWRRFESHLDGLRDALSAAGAVIRDESPKTPVGETS